MADEASTSIANLFPDTAPAAQEASPVTAADGTPETPAEPAEQYVPGRVPKAFYREGGDHDYDGLSKSWFDTRSAYETAQARIRELEGAQEKMPETFESYAKEMDWKAVAEKAPKAYKGSAEDGTNKAALSLLKRAYENGVPMAKARAMVTDFYADLDEFMPDPIAPEEARKSAVGYLGPNGASMEAEVKEWLVSREARKPFTAPEQAVLAQMVRNGPALSLLWEFTRSAGAAAPPGGVEHMSSAIKDPEVEKREATKLLGTLDDAEWHRNKDAIVARWRAAHPEAA